MCLCAKGGSLQHGDAIVDLRGAVQSVNRHSCSCLIPFHVVDHSRSVGSNNLTDLPIVTPDENQCAAKHVIHPNYCPTNENGDVNGNGDGNSVIDTHHVFLVHGWMGSSKSLGYVEIALNKEISRRSTSSLRVVVHNTKANMGKTSDGIDQGGRRITLEIQSVVEKDQQ